MPSQLVDVGGYKLHINCTSSGTPAVVLEAGLGEPSSMMAGWIAPAVAASTKVCVYDRAGQGWSEPAAAPQDGLATAAALHTLLARAHVSGPYVLVGHSTGGIYMQIFAATYPGQVAGMVLRDSQAPERVHELARLSGLLLQLPQGHRTGPIPGAIRPAPALLQIRGQRSPAPGTSRRTRILVGRQPLPQPARRIPRIAGRSRRPSTPSAESP
jgi:pimeloyl-ACP methyl ester carboxylesterase